MKREVLDKIISILKPMQLACSRYNAKNNEPINESVTNAKKHFEIINPTPFQLLDNVQAKDFVYEIEDNLLSINKEDREYFSRSYLSWLSDVVYYPEGVAIYEYELSFSKHGQLSFKIWDVFKHKIETKNKYQEYLKECSVLIMDVLDIYQSVLEQIGVKLSNTEHSETYQSDIPNWIKGNNEQKQEILKRLHFYIDNIGKRKAATACKYIAAAVNAGAIEQPEYSQVKSEFPNIGVESGYYKQISKYKTSTGGNKTVFPEIEPYISSFVEIIKKHKENTK